MRPIVLALIGAFFAIARVNADDAQTGTVTMPDGVSIAYEARGKGNTTLLFLHGWSCDRSHWKEQLDPFSKDYKVVAIDLAGHSQSGTNRERWTVAGLADDVAQLVKALDLKRVVLVGHSMGGTVAVLAAPKIADRVIGVVGVDTLHNVEYKWDPEWFNKTIAQFETDFETAMEGFLNGMFPKETDPMLVAAIRSKAQKANRKAAVGLFRDLPNYDLKGSFSKVKVPIRSINAAVTEGMKTMPTAIETNRKYADFGVVLIENVGHWPMLEKPAEFNHKLRDVLREIAAR